MTFAPATAALATFLGDEEAPKTFGFTSAELLEACASEDVISLLHQRFCQRKQDDDWLVDFREEVASKARAEAVIERLRQREIISVLEALAAEGVHPILLKGTPLAYGVYDTPSLRPRSDTDLLIGRERLDIVRRVMTELGYWEPTHCSGELSFCQFALEKTDDLGVHHQFDVHWKISTQSAFACILTYDELTAEAAPVPALGRHARAAGLLHALLLACIHPAMHHRSIERLIWIYDIHLLASKLGAREFDRFVALAVAKQVATIVEYELKLARATFRTPIPSGVMDRLAAPHPPERSAAYLRTDRRWHNELVSNFSDLTSWRDRLSLLREVVFPEPDYMWKAYGIPSRPPATIALSLLYLHRGAAGAWKVLSGRK